MQPLKMSLTAFAKLLAKPKTRPLELNFFLSRLLHCTSHCWCTAWRRAQR